MLYYLTCGILLSFCLKQKKGKIIQCLVNIDLYTYLAIYCYIKMKQTVNLGH